VFGGAFALKSRGGVLTVLGGVAGPGSGGCAYTPRAPTAADAQRLLTK